MKKGGKLKSFKVDLRYKTTSIEVNIAWDLKCNSGN